MLLVSKEEDTIVDMGQVALTIEQDGAIWQILATPYGSDLTMSYVLNEYYSKEDALTELGYALRAYVLKDTMYCFGGNEE